MGESPLYSVIKLAFLFDIKNAAVHPKDTTQPTIIAIPLFVLGIALCFIPFNVVWRYFGWSNQTLATIALWAAVKYLANRGKNYWIALIPAMFMTVVVTSYILAAPEGFVRFFGDKDIKVIEHIAIVVGCVVSLGCTAAFFMSNKKANLITE